MHRGGKGREGRKDMKASNAMVVSADNKILSKWNGR